jgi:RNA polymerase sigma-70 factor (family 1)
LKTHAESADRMFGIVLNSFTKKDLREAYEAHFDALRAFLYYKTMDTDLSEDLVQEVFIKVWEKRKEIKKETLKSLLYTIANNLFLNHVNHLKVVRSHENEQKVSEAVNQQTPQYLFEEKEFEIKFNRVIEDIPEGSREVFLMNRIEKIKYEEIADRLEISIKAVEKRMSKALQIIRTELGAKL